MTNYLSNLIECPGKVTASSAPLSHIPDRAIQILVTDADDLGACSLYNLR